jgi:hypothetical protein
MRPFTARTLLLAALVLPPSPSSVHAQSAADPTGHWEGVVHATGMDVAIEIDLARNNNGEFEGTFGQPAQNLKGLPLANFAVNDTAVSFQIKGGAPGVRAFTSTLSADGKSMSGDFASQFGTFPFSLSRTGNARIAPPARSAAIGKQLEGTWNGTLDVDGRQLRLILTMSNHPDGTAAGTIVNVDEGLELPIAVITQQAAAVTLDITVAPSSYSGTLNPEGTELVGTFTQGPVSAPLTFRRTGGK